MPDKKCRTAHNLLNYMIGINTYVPEHESEPPMLHNKLKVFRTIYKFFAILALIFLTRGIAMAAPIPVEIKKVVAFVFAEGAQAEVLPLGTAFFVGVKAPGEKNKYFVYMVTAKHVIKDHVTNNYISNILVRLNTKDGKSQIVKIPIITEGEQRTVFFHEDESVDLAVIPCLPDLNIYDYLYSPDDMITTKEAYKKLNIREGNDVFFTGLFAPFPGVQRNYPIFRFGRVALVTEEKIEWQKNKFCDLYLIEAGSYGGNSGSPVFFYLGQDRKENAIVLGPPVIKLAGIMQGTYLDTREVKLIESAKETKVIPLAQSSMGIAAVVPAYKLHEVLFGSELTKRR
ncbi:MAG: serine protease [Desulfarculaceae bacterium]|nr:serine protease [Desulfarculaceae bacterium]